MEIVKVENRDLHPYDMMNIQLFEDLSPLGIILLEDFEFLDIAQKSVKSKIIFDFTDLEDHKDYWIFEKIQEIFSEISGDEFSPENIDFWLKSQILREIKNGKKIIFLPEFLNELENYLYFLRKNNLDYILVKKYNPKYEGEIPEV